jgi:predicted enzyme related to lactoylglutathione lyase
MADPAPRDRHFFGHGRLAYIQIPAIDVRTSADFYAGIFGAPIVTPPYLEGDVWVATFRDPAGNVIGIWQKEPR